MSTTLYAHRLRAILAAVSYPATSALDCVTLLVGAACYLAVKHGFQRDALLVGVMEAYDAMERKDREKRDNGRAKA